MTTPERPAALPQPIEPDDATLQAWLRATADYAFRQMSGVAALPSFNTEGAAAVVREVRAEPLPERGRSLGDVMAKRDPAIQASFTTPGPGYLAYIPGGGSVGRPGRPDRLRDQPLRQRRPRRARAG
jgi:aromatic-L-amino-acid decarboxylase